MGLRGTYSCAGSEAPEMLLCQDSAAPGEGLKGSGPPACDITVPPPPRWLKLRTIFGERLQSRAELLPQDILGMPESQRMLGLGWPRTASPF